MIRRAGFVALRAAICASSFAIFLSNSTSRSPRVFVFHPLHLPSSRPLRLCADCVRRLSLARTVPAFERCAPDRIKRKCRRLRSASDSSRSCLGRTLTTRSGPICRRTSQFLRRCYASPPLDWRRCCLLAWPRRAANNEACWSTWSVSACTRHVMARRSSYPMRRGAGAPADCSRRRGHRLCGSWASG